MATSLLSLPNDILVLLPDFLHNIEDYTNLSGSCRTLRACMHNAGPKTILRLAAAQDRVFFRPSPYFLVAATARELGNWARASDANESELATKLQNGVDALMDLALEHCGTTLDRLRELYEMRFSIINPIYDIIDRCVGKQWYAHENFWNGGVSDAYTIDSEPAETFWHLIIYGELFAPDIEATLNGDTSKRRLSVETRLEFVKYCIPDFATTCWDDRWITLPNGELDPRRTVKDTGPYAKGNDGRMALHKQHNIALTWVIRSSRWKPHWKAMRELAGPDFQEDMDDGWWYNPDSEEDWKQRFWENMMICQGLNGMGMMRPQLRSAWVEKVKQWRENVSQMEREPQTVEVGRQATLQSPYLLGDLRVCASGYVGGT